MHLRLQQRAFRREVQIAFGIPSFNTYEVVDTGTWASAAWHTRRLWKHVGIPLVCSILPSPGLMTKPTKSLISYLSVTLTAHSRHSNTGLALSGTVYPRSHEGGYEELSSRNPSEQFAKALISDFMDLMQMSGRPCVTVHSSGSAC